MWEFSSVTKLEWPMFVNDYTAVKTRRTSSPSCHYSSHLRSALIHLPARQQARADGQLQSLCTERSVISGNKFFSFGFNTATVMGQCVKWSPSYYKMRSLRWWQVPHPFTFFPLIVFCAIKKRTRQGPPIGSAYLPLKASLNFMFTSGSPSRAVFLPLVPAHKKVLGAVKMCNRQPQLKSGVSTYL